MGRCSNRSRRLQRICSYAGLQGGIFVNMDDANAQAYGARQFELVGISLQRGSLICLTAFLLLLPVWLNFEPLMIAMGRQM